MGGRRPGCLYRQSPSAVAWRYLVEGAPDRAAEAGSHEADLAGAQLLAGRHRRAGARCARSGGAGCLRGNGLGHRCAGSQDGTGYCFPRRPRPLQLPRRTEQSHRRRFHSVPWRLPKAARSPLPRLLSLSRMWRRRPLARLPSGTSLRRFPMRHRLSLLRRSKPLLFPRGTKRPLRWCFHSALWWLPKASQSWRSAAPPAWRTPRLVSAGGGSSRVPGRSHGFAKQTRSWVFGGGQISMRRT